MSFDAIQEFYDKLEPEDFSIFSYKDELQEEISNLKDELKRLKFQMNKEKEDRELFIKRHLNNLKKEIYGTEQLDTFKLDSSISNIAWIVGQTNDKNRIIKVQRKGE